MSDASDAQDHLKRGLVWFGSATVAMQLIDLAAGLMLLVYLDRAEMGLAALAWSVAVILESVNGLGVDAALIQAPGVSRVGLSSLFWLSLGVAAVGVALAALLAPFIAAFFHEPQLVPMVVVSSLKLVFVAAALVPLHLLLRELKFKESGAVQAIATLLAALTKIALAASGAGAWAPVLANVARGLYLVLALLVLAPWRPALVFSWAETRGLLGFGLRVTLSRIVSQFTRNADFMVVGRVLGLEALGLYRVAFDIAMAPMEAFANLVQRVAFPVFARVAREPARLTAAFAAMGRYVVLLVGPVAAFFSFASAPLLSAVMGGKWSAAAPMLTLLAWAALLRTLAQLFPQLYNAAGRSGLGLAESVLSGSVLGAGFVVAATTWGARLGPMSVAWAWLLCYPPLLAVLLVLAREVAGIGILAWLRQLMPPALALLAPAAAMAVVAGAVVAMSPGVQVALLATVGLAVYALSLRLVLGMRLADLRPRAA